MKPQTEGYAFRVTASDDRARTGELTTPHGVVETPTFMPVGTQGSVKTLSPFEVAATGARIVGKAASLLRRQNGRYALATQCIGGGQGIATVLEAVE